MDQRLSGTADRSLVQEEPHDRVRMLIEVAQNHVLRDAHVADAGILQRFLRKVVDAVTANFITSRNLWVIINTVRSPDFVRSLSIVSNSSASAGVRTLVGSSRKSTLFLR